MSGSSSNPAEPNLTPILDMVFQLITFFMLVMNFKAAEIDATLLLPVIGSAKPLPGESEMKLLVLNVQIVTKCPKCDANATIVRNVDEITKKVLSWDLRCERGHVTSFKEGAITNGKTALSIYGRLLTKEKGDANHPSIVEYLGQEAEASMMAAKPPLTRDEIEKEGKELVDTIVIRADSTCPFGAVNYIITECQKKGYRKFALKTGMLPPPK